MWDVLCLEACTWHYVTLKGRSKFSPALPTRWCMCVLNGAPGFSHNVHRNKKLRFQKAQPETGTGRARGKPNSWIISKTAWSYFPDNLLGSRTFPREYQTVMQRAKLWVPSRLIVARYVKYLRSCRRLLYKNGNMYSCFAIQDREIDGETPKLTLPFTQGPSWRKPPEKLLNHYTLY